MSEGTSSGVKGVRVHKYVPAVGPRLKKLLYAVLGLFSLLFINGAYLVGITLAEWSSGETIQNYFYLNMFLVHLVLGVLLILPFLVFGIIHIRNSRDRKNRIAARVGYALFGTGLLLILSGVLLTRVEGLIEVKEPMLRSVYPSPACRPEDPVAQGTRTRRGRRSLRRGDDHLAVPGSSQMG